MSNCGPTRIDPIGGLLDYVRTVKPYHTKILESTVEYVQIEPVSVYIAERLFFDIYMTEPQSTQQFDCVGGYGIIWDSTGQTEFKFASQAVTIAPNKLLTDLTGIPNVALPLFTFTIVINGNPYVISLVGTTVQTFQNLVTQLNLQLQAIAVPDKALVTFDGNNFLFRTQAVGSTNTLYIIDETFTNPDFLFTNMVLTSYVFETPQAGADGGDATVQYNVIDIDNKHYRITLEGDHLDVMLPGTKIKLFNSAALNSGCYNVYSASFDGTDTIIQLMQPIRERKPIGQQYYGYATIATIGYSDPNYCYPICQDPLDVHAFIIESLRFSWGPEYSNSVTFNDPLVVAIEEIAQAVVATSDGQPLLPSSLDGPALDMATLDENLDTIVALYNQSM